MFLDKLPGCYPMPLTTEAGLLPERPSRTQPGRSHGAWLTGSIHHERDGKMLMSALPDALSGIRTACL